MGLYNTLGSLIGGAASAGVGETLGGVGDAAVKIRSAITGDLPPDKRVELEKALLVLDAAIADHQAKVNEIEAASPSFFIAGWRPAVAWICVAGFGYFAVAQPLLLWASLNFGIKGPPAVDAGALITILTGLLGLGTLRTFEKVKDVHGAH